jgi:hypothetical protein
VRATHHFTALLHHVSEDCLREAFFNLKKTAAVGIDSVRWHEYERNVEANIANLHGRIHLIRKWLHAGIMEEGEWSKTTVGAPQGSVISPLLSNVYLHYVFNLWGETGRWLRSVVQGWLNYHAVPSNSDRIGRFVDEVTRHWLVVLRRRSQRGCRGWTWQRVQRLARLHLPRPRIVHPYPDQRFRARLEVGAV